MREWLWERGILWLVCGLAVLNVMWVFGVLPVRETRTLSPQQITAICAGVEVACINPTGSTGHVNCERALDNCVKARELGR